MAAAALILGLAGGVGAATLRSGDTVETVDSSSSTVTTDQTGDADVEPDPADVSNESDTEAPTDSEPDSDDNSESGPDDSTTDAGDSTTSTTTTTLAPTIDAAEAVQRFAPSVVALEAMGCRSGAIGTGVAVSSAEIYAPFDFRHRSGTVSLATNVGNPTTGTVLPSPNLVTKISGRAQSSAPVALVDAEVAVGDTIFVVYREASTRAAAVSETTVSDVSSNRFTVELGTIKTEMVGGLAVSRSGDPIGFISAKRLSALWVTPTAALETDLASTVNVTSPCASAVDSIDPSRWADFADPSISSAMLAQHLASSLADAQWNTVRALEPGKSDYTNSTFQNGWGTLVASTLVPVWDDPMGTTHRWRMGLIAHEIDGGSEVTRVFCVTWEANIGTGTVAQLAKPLAERLGDLEGLGFTDPTELVDEVLTNCQRIDGD